MSIFPSLKTAFGKDLSTTKKFATANDNGQYDAEDSISPLHLLPIGESEAGLWQKAWKQIYPEVGHKLPVEWHLESLNLEGEVKQIAQEARLRADGEQQNERKIAGTKHTYREVYDHVANWANQFIGVGDLVMKADPGYAAIPWAIVRFAISTAAGESETYHRMIKGVEHVSQLVTQYPVIERTFAQVDSGPGAVLRENLTALYVNILYFQVDALQYFDEERKAHRAIQGINPVTKEKIRQQREAIDDARDLVDHDLALVRGEVLQHGIQDISEGQKELLEGQRDFRRDMREGILSLARNTGKAFTDQRNFVGGKFEEAEQRNQQRNDALLEIWQKPLDALSKKMYDEEVEREKEVLRDIRQWLSTAEPGSDLLDARAKRQMRTLGDWLLVDDKFKSWIERDESSILWLWGFAGTGKSGLACRVIEYIEDGGLTAGNHESGKLAYFFCSNNYGSHNASTARSDPEEALRSIASQLSTSEHTRSAADIVQAKYAEYGPHSDKRRKLNHGDCEKIIIAVAKQVQITIITDAFDELDREKSPILLKCFQNIVQNCPDNVRIFLTTRSFAAIEDELQLGIEVTTEKNGEDVRKFIRETLQNQIEDGALLKANITPNLKAEIESILASRARNMFLYASLLLDRICDRNSNDDEFSIRQKLTQLPDNLTAIYDETVEQIHDDKNNSPRSCQLAQDTLKWLLVSKGALLCEFLIEAVSPPGKRATADEILRACRTLVVKGRIQGKDMFEPAHLSVREHVSQLGEYSPSKCAVVAVKSCLRVLSTLFATHPRENEDLETDKGFRKYALLNWPLHLEALQQEDLEEHRVAINLMLRKFLLDDRLGKDKFARWYKQAGELIRSSQDGRDPTSKYIHLRAEPLSPLFAACVFGLDDLIGKFGRELNGLNRTNASGQTALCLAIEHGNFAVVKTLTSRRFPADINLLNVLAVQQFEDLDIDKPPETILYASALQCAAAVGNVNCVKHLLDEGAQINLVAGYYGSPLQAASHHGHEEVVALLLQRGAEPNSQGGFLGNALQAAAAAGHINVLNTLLENKPAAALNVPGGFYGSALMAAISSGDIDTIWALLEEDATPNLRSKHHGLPLEKAAAMGEDYREIVSLLLQSHAEVDVTQDKTSMHTLHNAAKYNMVDLAEHCLKRGCKIDMITTEASNYHRRFSDFAREMTPLGCACAEGHAEMVEYLLSKGAPYEIDNPNAAPLWTAAYQGHANVVDVLLRLFKETHTEDEVKRLLSKSPGPKSGHPVLFAAVSSGNPEVVTQLLRHGAKYESNWFNATPLLATATFKCPTVTKELLQWADNGKIDVQINKRTNNGRTALIEACALNQQAVLQHLLDAGADCTIVDNGGATALHLTTIVDNKNLLECILEKASRTMDNDHLLKLINTRHSTGRTVLVDCVARYRPENLQLLIDHGADYTIAGNDGWTVLHHAAGPELDYIIEIIVSKAKNDHQKSPEHVQGLLDRQNKDSKTALHLACEFKHPHTVELLLKHGANYNIVNKQKVNGLHAAAWENGPKTVSVLLDFVARHASQDDFRAFIDHRVDRGNTALADAAERGNLEVVNILLHYRADVCILDNRECSILHKAGWPGHIPVLTSLLDHIGKNESLDQYKHLIDQRNDQSETALAEACQNGRMQVVKLLLNHGADFTLRNKREVTVFHKACWPGHIHVVQELLAFLTFNRAPQEFHGLLNHCNDEGHTAFADVCFNGHADLASLLLDAGADYTISNPGKVSPLHKASHNGYTSCVSILLNFIRKSLPDRNSSQAFLNQRNDQGKTALMDACQNGHLDIINLLLTHGADYTIRDNTDCTALHWCAFRKHASCVQALLSTAAADRNKFNSSEEQEKIYFAFLNSESTTNGATALRDAVVVDDIKITKLLLEYGAEWDVPPLHGKSVLHFASEKRENADILEALFQAASERGEKSKFERAFEVARNGEPWERLNTKMQSG